ncbi:MAG: discoidin domain-containing protein [Deltaproteobacteria bacterium]|nr:discoidin domain-containing protein [Deltaproteobacteria bacterium]MBN2670855.1 discoidin domain-containing protein [Deltaproteobacteria bacterium]
MTHGRTLQISNARNACEPSAFGMFTAFVLFTAILFSVSCQKTQKVAYEDETLRTGDGTEYLAHEVVVKIGDNTSLSALESELKKYGAEVVNKDSRMATQLGIYRVLLPKEVTADVVISQLMSDGITEVAERNYVVSVNLTPNDPMFTEQWNLAIIDAEKAWDITTGAADVVVGVSDSGLDFTHEDFVGNIWENPGEVPGNGIDDDQNGYVDDVHGWDWKNGDNDSTDEGGHGTAVSGVIGAVGNNAKGVAGINWNVKIAPLKFINASGSGTLMDAAESILYAAEMNIRVVNASWGCSGCYSDYFADVIDRYAEAGGILVAAAGNDAKDIDKQPQYPAAYGHDNIISVGASWKEDTPFDYSNWGKMNVDVVAPGRDIPTTTMGGGYGYKSGTSLAAPHAAGVIAMYWAVNPDASAAKVKQRLIATCDPASALKYKSACEGRINAYRMLSEDDEPPAAPENLVAEPGDQNDAILTWDPVDDPGLAMYTCEWGPAPGQYLWEVLVPGDQNMTIIEGLQDGVPYYFVCYATDKSGNVSLPSNEATMLPKDELSPPQVIDLRATTVPGPPVSGSVHTASSEASTFYQAENAYDGSTATAWLAAPSEDSAEEYLIIDFNQPSTIERVMLSPVAAYPEFFPVDFDIEVSNDGSSWTVVAGLRNVVIDDVDEKIDLAFPSVTAAHLRLRILTTSGYDSGFMYTGVSEIEVFAPSDVPDAVQLTFTAPGDDPGNGVAERYEVRYSTEPITQENFLNATLVNWDSPSASGVLEQLIVDGLEAETTYWFAVRAVDEVGNYSMMSNVVAAATSTILPGTVSNLEILSNMNGQIFLTWNAPGNNGYEGQAATYALRWSLNPLHAGNFGDANPVDGIPTPLPAGTNEMFEITDLQHASEPIYLAIAAVDEKGHMGGISNVVELSPELDMFDETPPARVENLHVFDSLQRVRWVGEVIDSSSHLAELYAARNLFDGDALTMWITEELPPELPEWVTVDLGVARSINQFRLNPAVYGNMAANFPRDFVLSVSADNINWQPVVTVEGQEAESGEWLEWNFDMVAARYVKIDVSLRGSASCNEPTECNQPSKVVISELEINGPTSDFDVDLQWIAPGDDGWDGKAYAYDLRHSLELITEENFDAAAQVAIAQPLNGGMFEVHTIADLDWGEDHFFALKTQDSSGNWSEMSNVAYLEAVYNPPAPVNDLAASNVTQTSATLRWTATGDDGTDGQAVSYDLRYSKTPLSINNWHLANIVFSVPTPGVSGTTETITVNDLDPGSDYFFALRVHDDEGSVSLISNMIHFQTVTDTPPLNITDLQAIPVDYSDDDSLPLEVQDVSSAFAETAGADMLVDGDHSSAWLSDKQAEMQTEFVEFALAAPTLLSDVRILPAAGYEDMFPVSFMVQVREGDGLWETVINEDFFYIDDENASFEEWSIGAVMADSIRLEIVETPSSSFGFFNAIAEIEVYEAPTRFDTIELSWTAPATTDGEDGAASYDLRHHVAPITASTFNATAALAGIGTPREAGLPEFFEVTDLEPETKYCFALKATDTVGNSSGISNSPCAFTPGVPPATVVDLHIDSISTNSASLTWTAPGGDWKDGKAAKYELRVYEERINKTSWSDAGIYTGVPIPGNAGTTEEMVVTGLKGDTDYYFAVVAVDAAGNRSGISNNAVGHTGDNVAPLAITDLVVDTDFETWGTLFLSWTAPGDSGPIGQADRYDIRVSTTPITAMNFENALSVTPVGLVPHPSGEMESVVLTGLNPETEYFVTIKAADTEGNWSAVSNVPSSRTRDEIPGKTTDLEVVETHSYELGNSTVLLQWSAPGDDDMEGIATTYEFRYSYDPITPENFEDATLATVDLTPAPGTTLQMTTIGGLQEGINYCFALRAIDERDNIGRVSNSACTITADGVPPATIWNLFAKTGSSRGTVDLTWTHPGDDDTFGQASAYDLRWSFAPITAENFADAAPTATQPVPKTAGTEAKFTAHSLPDEVLLHFAIKAVDDEGNWSAVSNDAPARTPDVPPAAIDDLEQVGIGMTSISIAWTAVGDDEYLGLASGYDLRYSLLPIFETNFNDAMPYSIPAPQPPGSSESATIEGLVAGTTYYVAIKTVDDRGNWSPISNLLEAYTQDVIPPGQIDPLEVSEGVKPGSLRLDWTATGDDGDVGTATRYEIRYAFECVTEANWDSATVVENEIKPRPSGSLELFNIEGLEGETLYYIGIRAVDEVGNVGLISPCASGETAPVAPEAITDLEGEAIRPRSVVLTWTAPFDVGDLGKAVEYDIRYAMFKITDKNFYSAPRFTGAPVPAAAGTPETTTVSGLNESTLYYFAIKSIDNKGAVSAMSNVAEVMTLDETPPAAPQNLNANTTNSFTGNIPALSATVSSQLVDILGAENTIDDDETTMWVSDASSIPQEEWLMLDLGEIVEVDRVRLLPNADYIHLFPQNFTISVSETGEEWVDVLTVEGFTAHTESWMTFGFDPALAQFVRVTSFDPEKSYFGLYYTVLSGMEVFGAATISGRTTLTWIAPGDDMMVGTATYYEVFYAENPFDASDLDLVSSMVIECVEPAEAYTPQGVTMSGFKGETRYYWALRAVDEADNIGEISEVATAMSEDAQPAIVTDLHSSGVTKTSITLAWTATGDDGRSGTAASYELRYAPWSLTLENFPFATEVTGMPVPQAAGTAQSVKVTGLDAGTRYHFALVVIDEKGASSYLSNIAQVRTNAAPDSTPPSAITDLNAHVVSEDGDKLLGVAEEWTSEQAPEYVADNLADGDVNTSWVTAAQDSADEQSVTLDLGAVYPVGEMRFRPDDSFVHLFPVGLEVRVSVDGLQWTTVYTGDDLVAKAGESIDTIFPVTAMRYVEVAATELAIDDNDYYYAVMSEVEILHAQSDPGTVVITWTATGDDAAVGTADSYYLRYSTCPFAEGSATEVETYIPDETGSAELARISGLAAGTYCAVISAFDEARNESALSNTVEITVP